MIVIQVFISTAVPFRGDIHVKDRENTPEPNTIRVKLTQNKFVTWYKPWSCIVHLLLFKCKAGEYTFNYKQTSVALTTCLFVNTSFPLCISGHNFFPDFSDLERYTTTNSRYFFTMYHLSAIESCPFSSFPLGTHLCVSWAYTLMYILV